MTTTTTRTYSYRGETIERVYGSGYYSAHVLYEPRGFYLPCLADTLAGCRAMVAAVLDGTDPRCSA